MLALSIHADRPVTLTDATRTIQVSRDDAGRLTVNLPAPGPKDVVLLYLGGTRYRISGNRRHSSDAIPLAFEVPDDCQVTREAAALAASGPGR